MSSVFLRDVGGLAPFRCSDTAGISARWERWPRAFELFADGKGVKHADQKKALMLHTAGLSVQDIFFTLDEGTGENNYLKAKDALDKYFKPQANVPYERLCFREMSQLPSETVEQFVTRLRQKAQSCEFGDAAAVDEQIRDQVISKCLSHNIRRKHLEKGKILTLQQLREIARVMEDSEKQARKIEGAANEVNRVSVNSNEKGNPRVCGKQSTVRCFCCGNVGHKANDKVCPARGKRCRKCNNPGHFEKVCKTKLKTSEGRKGGKDRRVRQVGVGVDETDDSEYAFGVLGGADNPDNGEISVKIGEVQVTMIIDSESEGHALLGRETAIALGVLQLGPQINSLQLSTDGENREPSILDKFSVKYIPGPKNIADSLSRLLHPTSKSKERNRTDEYVQWVAQESTPVALTTREIESASEEDPELQSVRECLLSGRWHDIEFKEYLPMRGELCAIGKLVLRGTRIVVPKELRSHVLELAHEGHPGIVAMKQRLRSKVWWPGLDKDAERVCKTCHGCQLVSQPLKPEPMTRTEFPSAPWQHLAADLLGPLPSGDYIFVVVDYSRFFEMEFTKSITTEKIVSLMSKMFVTHSLPLFLKN
ncbi:uncharacterized protein [Montipora foliosa]|uniref:uncharacterized protein n=1 Tax=Montipora foliosa TaxID=591990 RepID=UPI0035F159D4